ncbi:MAG: M48 family metallopeptidase [Thermodesulfobacteriota bacterium]
MPEERFGQEEFARMAGRAEEQAKRNLPIYKLKLLLYAALGYAVIFLVIFLLLGLTSAIVASAFFSTGLFILLVKKKILFIILPTIWLLAKALWVRFDSPEGYQLSQRQYPVLFAEIERLSRELRSKKIHQVLLTPEFNAAVVQTPRLGIFGWEKNSLILGLELLLTLSPEQARSVLAHEFGHLSGNHSRFSGWIYRVRASWQRIMDSFALAHKSWGAKLMGRFCNWYSPRFAAYSFALARSHEYEADMIAARLTSPAITAAALVNSHVAAGYLDNSYWSRFFKQADQQPAPTAGPWAELANFWLAERGTDPYLANLLAENLKEETEFSDTHPALRDRLAALAVAADLPGPTAESAAKVWLARGYATVIGDFDRDWLEYNGEKWRQRYDYVLASKKTMTELAGKEVAELADEELWRLAILSEEFAGDEKALPLLREYQRRQPDDMDGAFVLGRILARAEDEELLAQLKIAISSPSLAVEACQLAHHYLQSRGRAEESEWWRQVAIRQEERDEESQRERGLLQVDDNLGPARELSDEDRAAIVAALSARGDVKKAWLAAKELKHYPEVPALAIAVQLRGFIVSANKKSDEIAAELEVPGTLFLVPKNGDFKPLAKKIIKHGERLF